MSEGLDIVREIRDTARGKDKRIHELAQDCADELERCSANRDFWMMECKKADKARMSAVRELEEAINELGKLRGFA